MVMDGQVTTGPREHNACCSSVIITAPPFTLRGVPVPTINVVDTMDERHVKAPTAVQIVLYRYLSLKHRRVAHEASLKSVCHYRAAG